MLQVQRLVMAASFRIPHAGKKLPYFTALKGAARDVGHGENRRAYLRYGNVPSHIPAIELQTRSLEDPASKLRLKTIGYEDRRPPPDKPKPSHPGEYVTSWGDFRPQPKGQIKPSTHKSTSAIASLLLSKPEESAWISRPVHHERRVSFALLMGTGRDRPLESPVRTTALVEKEMEGVSRSAILSALSSNPSSVLDQVNIGVFGHKW